MFFSVRLYRNMYATNFLSLLLELPEGRLKKFFRAHGVELSAENKRGRLQLGEGSAKKNYDSKAISLLNYLFIH